MFNLFSSQSFREGHVASNETFKDLKIPDAPPRTLTNTLEENVASVLVKGGSKHVIHLKCAGYRPGEGVDANRWPTAPVCAEARILHLNDPRQVARLTQELAHEERRTTTFTQFARGEAG